MARFSNNLCSNKKLSFEGMEERQMMAADVAFNAQTGVLTITGDAYDDYAAVTLSGSNASAVLYSDRADGTVDFHSALVPIASIRSIEFQGGNGDNHFEVNEGQLAARVSLFNKEIRYFGGNHEDEFFNNTSMRSTAYGGYGDDEFHGGSGIDTFYGERGEDYLYGNAGQDILDGGDDNDWVYGGNGDDTVFGGNGNNHLYGNAGNDRIIGGQLVDFIFGGNGNDILEGNDGNDIISGGNGDDHIYGGNGNDSLLGEDGYDRIFGGSGNDILNGGYDGFNDYLEGGAGSDTFQSVYRRFYPVKWVIMEQDNVADFQVGDTIEATVV